MKKRDQKWLVGLICVFIVGVGLGALGHYALTRLQLKTPEEPQEATIQEQDMPEQETAEEEIKDTRDEEYIEAYRFIRTYLHRFLGNICAAFPHGNTCRNGRTYVPWNCVHYHHRYSVCSRHGRGKKVLGLCNYQRYHYGLRDLLLRKHGSVYSYSCNG